MGISRRRFVGGVGASAAVMAAGDGFVARAAAARRLRMRMRWWRGWIAGGFWRGGARYSNGGAGDGDCGAQRSQRGRRA